MFTSALAIAASRMHVGGRLARQPRANRMCTHEAPLGDAPLGDAPCVAGDLPKARCLGGVLGALGSLLAGWLARVAPPHCCCWATPAATCTVAGLHCDAGATTLNDAVPIETMDDLVDTAALPVMLGTRPLPAPLTGMCCNRMDGGQG